MVFPAEAGNGFRRYTVIIPYPGELSRENLHPFYYDIVTFSAGPAAVRSGKHRILF
jgi:hypothetical protein